MITKNIFIKILFSLMLFIGSISSNVSALTPPNLEWQKIYGGTYFDNAYSVQQTSDGGYIFAGDSASYGDHSSTDAWLYKTDSSGRELWNKTFGGSRFDTAHAVIQIVNGYIIAGETASYGNGVYSDAWIIKTDLNGNEIWNKTIGGTGTDVAYSVQEISDGYIIAGKTETFGGNASEALLIKVDPMGTILWKKELGGLYNDVAYSVHETVDSGFILAGQSAERAWIVKTDNMGNYIWDKYFVEYKPNAFQSIDVTQDGGFILAGWMILFGNTDSDALIIKTDDKGNEIWRKTYDAANNYDSANYNDRADSIQETSGGGYIAAGTKTRSIAGGKYSRYAWLIRLDGEGNTWWDQDYKLQTNDSAYSVRQTEDRGFIMAGSSTGYTDAWLIKVGKESVTPVSSCFDITSPGVYELTSDITKPRFVVPFDCINIMSSNVILDGTGHTIDGEGRSGSGNGIYAGAYARQSTLNNITLKNLKVKGWTNGIHYVEVQYGNIENNTINSNDFGISLEDSNYNTIHNNYFSNLNNALDDGNNSWNTTKPETGTNIIGGSWLGGNYWSDYRGNDTNGDGLGDTLIPYNNSANITHGGDYLPLILPLLPLPGDLTFAGFSSPSSVAVDGSGNIYVADSGNHRIQKFDPSGTWLNTIGGPINGSGKGQFNYPHGVAVDGSGNIYVADSGNHRIQKFDPSGTWLETIGPGIGNGQFNYPRGVAVDGSGNIYVADSGNHRIVVFGSVQSSTSQGTVRFETNTGRIQNLSAVDLNTLPLPPAGANLPFGLFRFNITGVPKGGSVTLTLTFPSNPGTTYWKYGATLSNSVAHWYIIPSITKGNTTTITLTDGGQGDDDLTANGRIMDDGGPGLDATAPTTEINLSGTSGNNGWYTSNVSVTLKTMDDGGSGVNKTEYSFDNATWIEYNTEFPITTEGITTLYYRSIDNAGNVEPTKNQTIKIDKSPPQITINTPASEYILNENVIAGWTTVDVLSGIFSETGTNPNGVAIDTATVGTKTFTVDSVDNAGNSATKTVSYHVSYNFAGFFQPIDNLPIWNSVKAGSALPVKFNLSGNQGLDIFATSYPTSQKINCDSNASMDDIEETVTAGASILSYNATIDQYKYVWKTEKAWAGSCRLFVALLKDSTYHNASFKFLK